MKSLVLALLLAQTSTQAGNGVVTGKITSPDGTPAAGVRVAVVPVPEANTTVPAIVLSSISQTDSTGSFRLVNIVPGPYYIMAGVVDRPSYYPGTANPGPDGIVRVTANGLVSNINFQLSQAAGLKVSGRITGANLTNPGFARVTLLPRNPPFSPQSATVKPDFTWEFSNVLSGDYSFQVSFGTLVLKENRIIKVEGTSLTDVELPMIDPFIVNSMQGFKEVWRVPGRWRGIGSDSRSGALYAAEIGRLVELDRDGKRKSDVSMPGPPILRVAHFSGSDQPVFLGFGTWSPAVQAIDSTGKILWTFPDAAMGAMGIDDVWPIDLDGDKSDEVVVGFNGSTGLYVLDSKGQVLWKAADRIGNVWHVSGGNVRGDGKPLVVSTSAAGKVHIFSDNGAKRTDLDAGVYANMVRVGKILPSDTSDTIIFGSMDATNSIAILVAMAGDGSKKWTIQLPAAPRPTIGAMYMAPGIPWVAVAMQGGVVHVVDAERGVVIATMDGQGQTPEVAWMPLKDGAAPLLAISSGNSLAAFQVTGTASKSGQ